MTAHFISDLHLSPAQPAITQRLLDYLAGVARQADALYILGDLFDAWIGDDDLADPFNAAIAAALKQRTLAGGQTFLLPGNRDFLLGETFAAATGVTLLADETLIDLCGIRSLLLHGDTLCADDADYLAYRAQVRSAQWRADFLARPLPKRRQSAQQLRAQSEAQKQAKPIALMDVNADAVAAAFARHSARLMIHGHTHRPARHKYAGGQQRWVLPQWSADSAPTLLICHKGHCEWMSA